MKVLLEKLSQESTWRGIIAVAGGFGVAFAPDQQEAIIAGVLGVVGIINIFKKD